MKQRLEFFVEGKPVPQARPRVVRLRNGGVKTYTPPRSSAWRRAIEKEMWAQGIKRLLLKTPTVVTLRFYIPQPGGKKARVRVGPCCMSTAGDGDNLEKAVLDAMCDVRAKSCGYGLLHDDRFVVGCTWTKEWAVAPQKAGVRVTVEWDDAIKVDQGDLLCFSF